MIELALTFAVATVISAACLWAGMKLTRVDGTFLAMLIIAATSSLVGVIPHVGWLLSFIVMFVLICKWTTAEFWPDAVLMVIVANLVAIAGSVFLVGAIASM